MKNGQKASDKSLMVKLLVKKLNELVLDYNVDKALMAVYWSKCDPTTDIGEYYFPIYNRVKTRCKGVKAKLVQIRRLLKMAKSL